MFGGQGVESIAVEEFVEGHEGFYDTIAVDGHVAMDFVSHYYPNVLEAMRTRWISPQFVSTNRLDTAPEYGELREMGARVIDRARHRHLGHAHGVVLRAEGAAVLRDRLPAARRGRLGPVLGGQRHRPLPGSGRTPSCTAGSARCRPGGTPAGSSPCGPTQDGSISGYSGVDELQQRYGEWVIDAHLPPPGTPTQGVEAGYMANAYVRMRHPDYDTLRGMLDDGGPHACTSTPREDRPARTAAQADARGGGPVAGPPVRGRRARWPRSRPGGRSASPTTPSWSTLLGAAARSTWRCTGGGWTCRTATREYRAGERELAGVLAELQELYLLRLDYALQAVYAVQRRSGRGRGFR